MLYETQGPFRTMVDPETGTVDRSIFSDQAIYQMELERIFARAWNFMCHESQIKKPGDFFLSFIGEESVIATRDKKGDLQVLLNSCRHRGNAVCRAEEGNARSFLCTYHGWTYGLDGSLIGVPGYKDFYHEQLDKSQWGLVRAGKVQSYKGFVFATMDPEAPDLEDYLGPVGRMGLDLIAERGDMEIVGGIQKNIIGCNWKLAVDNLFDFYHPQISHASAFMSGFRKQLEGVDAAEQALVEKAEINGGIRNAHRVVLGQYGHAIGGPRLTKEVRDARGQLSRRFETLTNDGFRQTEKAQEALGEIGLDVNGHPNIFPNLWVATNGHQLSLRLPKGPDKCEIWWFAFVPREAEEWKKQELIERSIHVFGAAGLLEQDDGENWDQSTRAMKGVVAKRYPLNFGMGVKQGVVNHADGDLHYVDTTTNEHAQLWTYRGWAEWMDAESWGQLKQIAVAHPGDVV